MTQSGTTMSFYRTARLNPNMLWFDFQTRLSPSKPKPGQKANLGYAASVEVWHFFLAGINHNNHEVNQHFRCSASLASRAAEEKASDGLITAALLYFPCHMLASKRFVTRSWNSDDLIESGTFDWLLDWFGEEIAEVIRLQPHCRRYLASISRTFAESLNPSQQEQILQDGGEMSLESKLSFSNLRFFSSAMQLSRWIHQCNSSSDDRIELTPSWVHSSHLTCTASAVN